MGESLRGSLMGAYQAWEVTWLVIGLGALFIGTGLVTTLHIEEIRAGDVVYTPAGEWHWHGAVPDHFMIHLSITEAPPGDQPEADWGDHVTDDEYDPH
jgi:gentisate 1,2-dioxygenase